MACHEGRGLDTGLTRVVVALGLEDVLSLNRYKSLLKEDCSDEECSRRIRYVLRRLRIIHHFEMNTTVGFGGATTSWLKWPLPNTAYISQDSTSSRNGGAPIGRKCILGQPRGQSLWETFGFCFNSMPRKKVDSKKFESMQSMLFESFATLLRAILESASLWVVWTSPHRLHGEYSNQGDFALEEGPSLERWGIKLGEKRSKLGSLMFGIKPTLLVSEYG
ncbi:hypothetical protein BCR34DRAFT_584914 [Clohesyomyces aquaticus]|uniref:Uncharacterized protein n=1 Tax=Clohesyomyces aquaticus TaxID=1231657 RepID=A0A1Y1ZZQ7_9PLEO|nr:hypothetical protein BCR34DRAFT_584914 [Clohesyomyces aquaticus]